MKTLERPNFHDFEKHPVLRGQLGEPVLRPTDNGDQKAGSIMGYKVRQHDGSLIVMGASAQIETIVKDLEPGVYLRVTFKGKVAHPTKKGLKMNDFTVEQYDDENEYLADLETETDETGNLGESEPEPATTSKKGSKK